MYRSSRSRRPGLKMTILAVGCACLLAAGCQPGAAGPDDPAPGLTLVITDAGPPTLNGEEQPLGMTLDTLRSSPETATVRLPTGVDRDRLWELFATLEEQLPQERARGIGVELPRASGEGFVRFAEPPVFLILTAGGDVLFSIDASGPSPLPSIEDLSPLAATMVAGDPDAPFLLTPEDGAPAGLLPRVVEQLRQMLARNLLLFDDAGVRPLPAVSEAPESKPAVPAVGDGDESTGGERP